MSTILLCIDGTGPVLDREYAHDMRHSYVRRIHRNTHAEHKRYLRGPGFDGVDMFAIASEGYQFVHLHKFAHPDARVLLTGYSRGGSAVIDVARRLLRDGVEVASMMLFDPVDRSNTSDGNEVSTNVLRMIKALRDPSSLSRVSFGNCANIWHHPTRCEQQHFFCTHGGVGGVPWEPEAGQTENDYVVEGSSETSWSTLEHVYGSVAGALGFDTDVPTGVVVRTAITYQQDRRGADETWQWVEPRLRRDGFLG